MNKENVLGSLAQMKELSEEIARSQKYGQPLLADTTRKWGQQLRFHVELIHQELAEPAPVETAEAEPIDVQ